MANNVVVNIAPCARPKGVCGMFPSGVELNPRCTDHACARIVAGSGVGYRQYKLLGKTLISFIEAFYKTGSHTGNVTQGMHICTLVMVCFLKATNELHVLMMSLYLSVLWSSLINLWVWDRLQCCSSDEYNVAFFRPTCFLPHGVYSQ